MTSIVTSVVPQPGGSLAITTQDTLVTGATEILSLIGAWDFDPLLDAPFGTAATGSVDVEGTAHDLFGPDAGPGNTYLDLRLDGRICGL